MFSIMPEIREWATTLEYWERATLQLVVSGKEVDDEDIKRLADLLLQDAGVAEADGSRQELHFEVNGASGTTEESDFKLLAIGDLANVNALVPNQELEFSDALTTIFGENGSGKSGYARVLASAGFTRGDRYVLPNVRSQSTNDELSARVDYQLGGAGKSLVCSVGDPIPELSHVYVFDSTSVKVHLTGRNRFAFSPRGLEILTQMATLTDRVRDFLRAEQERRAQPRDFTSGMQGDSPVKTIVGGLSHQYDLSAIRQLATFTDREQARLEYLESAVAERDRDKQEEKVQKLKEDIEYLKKASDQVHLAEDMLSEKGILHFKELVDEKKNTERNVLEFGREHFQVEGLEHVGEPEWLRFLQAAKAWADLEEADGLPYPRAGDPCLLCQQPLTGNTHSLIEELWVFLEQRVEEGLASKKEDVEKWVEKIQGIEIEGFREGSSLHARAQALSEDKAKGLVVFGETVGTARNTVAGVALGDVEPAKLGVIESFPTELLEDLILLARGELRAITETAEDASLALLEQEIVCLKHRKQLAEDLDEVIDHLGDLKWVHRVANIGGSTAHITRKHNELFDQLVTNRYLQIFAKTLGRLERSLDIDVKMSGKKGETVKQIVLTKVVPEKADTADPEQVLSEGEKRAVALADFLTEVRLDPHCSTIVLDDPVTSLDLAWRDTVARLLVEEAAERQVIVFTHDMPFLYYLTRGSEDAGISLRSHWVRRELDGRPGHVFLDNSPARERDFKSSKIPRDYYERAIKVDSPEETERILRGGFGALRTCYEALIMFEMMNGVVQRFEEQVRFGNLKSVVWDDEIALQIVDKCELLSRYIEAHLHSDALHIRPTPKTLIQEIEEFDAIKKKLRSLRKMKAP